MAEPADGGWSRANRGRLRIRWRPTTHHAEPGPSSDAGEETGDWGRPLGSLAGMWRFLRFGLMRASVPLRTVISSGDPIRARARLEHVRIEERYYYRQQISRNPSAAERRDPAGRIKIVLPYDGERFFTRQAHRDVARAQRLGAHRDSGALVGFLALTNYDDTDLGRLLNLEGHHGSAPIKVPLPSAPGPQGADPLLADDSSCVVAHDYRPGQRTGQPIPVRIDIDLDDPDTIGIPPLPGPITSQLHARIARQASFKPELTLGLVVQLIVPRGLADGAHAMVSRVFVGWPTRTSLGSLELRVNGQKHLFQYNPQRAKTGGLEWRNVPLTVEPQSSSGGISVFSTPRMLLSIPNPGDLYRQNTLDGEVEVSVNRLLSGTDARLFDVTGRRSRQPRTELVTSVSTVFSLTLDDAFTRRVRSPHQQMHFGEVIPSAMRIDDMVTALQNRGFTVVTLASSESTDADSRPGAAPRLWWLSATRVHGPDKLSMLLCVEGHHYRTRRVRQVHDGMAHQTTVDSGDLELYVYGFLPGDSETVVREMNALRGALRERFDRLPARR
jgi:hypothetical protein